MHKLKLIKMNYIKHLTGFYEKVIQDDTLNQSVYSFVPILEF